MSDSEHSKPTEPAESVQVDIHLENEEENGGERDQKKSQGPKSKAIESVTQAQRAVISAKDAMISSQQFKAAEQKFQDVKSSEAYQQAEQGVEKAKEKIDEIARSEEYKQAKQMAEQGVESAKQKLAQLQNSDEYKKAKDQLSKAKDKLKEASSKAAEQVKDKLGALDQKYGVNDRLQKIKDKMKESKTSGLQAMVSQVKPLAERVVSLENVLASRAKAIKRGTRELVVSNLHGAITDLSEIWNAADDDDDEDDETSRLSMPDPQQFISSIFAPIKMSLITSFNKLFLLTVLPFSICAIIAIILDVDEGCHEESLDFWMAGETILDFCIVFLRIGAYCRLKTWHKAHQQFRKNIRDQKEDEDDLDELAPEQSELVKLQNQMDDTKQKMKKIKSQILHGELSDAAYRKLTNSVFYKIMNFLNPFSLIWGAYGVYVVLSTECGDCEQYIIHGFARAFALIYCVFFFLNFLRTCLLLFTFALSQCDGVSRWIKKKAEESDAESAGFPMATFIVDALLSEAEGMDNDKLANTDDPQVTIKTRASTAFDVLKKMEKQKLNKKKERYLRACQRIEDDIALLDTL